MPKLKMSSTTALRRAAAYMAKHGHSRGFLVDSHKRVCVWGAINVALSGDPCTCLSRSRVLLRFVEKYLVKQRGINRNAIAWNNDPTTKGAEVVAALRGAARLAAR